MKVPGLHIVLVSVIGSLFHIAGQLAVATVLLGSPLVWFTFPPLAVIACITGALTGWIAWKLIGAINEPAAAPCPCSEESASQLSGSSIVLDMSAAAASPTHAVGQTQDGAFARTQSMAKRQDPRNGLCNAMAGIDTKWLLAGFALYIIAVLCVPSPWLLCACALLAVVFAMAAQINARDVLKATLPLASILVVTAVAQILYNQNGTVILKAGPINITYDAVRTTLFMVVRLACIMLASISFVRAVPFERISRFLTGMLNKFSKYGMRADAFALALDLSISFIPVLTADFKKLRKDALEKDPGFAKGGLISKLKDYTALIIPLAAMAFSYADEVAEKTVPARKDTSRTLCSEA